jgi:hypothetical protein
MMPLQGHPSRSLLLLQSSLQLREAADWRGGGGMWRRSLNIIFSEASNMCIVSGEIYQFDRPKRNQYF